MRTWFLPITAAVAAVSAQGIQPAPSSTVMAAAGSLPLGAECASTEQCANGAQCFASTAWLIKQCGKFNAACDSDEQCATNTCNGGLCNGFLATTSYSSFVPPSTTLSSPSSTLSSATSSATTAATEGYQPAPSSTIVAAAGSLALGAECANSEQCSDGASCYASNSGLLKACGNFNAACARDSQCAYNTCSNGLCSGFLSSSAASPRVSSTPTGAGNGTLAASHTRSATPSAYTGAASKTGAVKGSLAVIVAAFAWML